MKSWLPPVFTAFFLALFSLPPLRAAEALQPGDLVALCGDSITRRMGYSVLVQEYLLMCQPVPEVNTAQFGRGFEKAADFVKRMEQDVSAFKPAAATICYGMNDGGYVPSKPATVDTYGQAMKEIVQNFKKAGVRFIVVASPVPVDPASYKNPRSTAEEYNKTLKDLSEEAGKVAKKEGVVFADINTLLAEATAKAKARYGADYKIAPDGIHPHPGGHLVMAYAFLKALGCDGNIGKLTVDFVSGESESDPGQKILSFQNGNLEVESTRYPFLLTGVPGDTGTRTMSEFIPFNQDLNRYVLVVKNSPPKARITWGKESLEFTKEQLEAGVNLAAEFSENPFRDAFGAGERAIRAQQKFESEEVKTLLDAEAKGEKPLPDENGVSVPVREYILKKDAELRAASKAAIAPVRHAIRVESL